MNLKDNILRLKELAIQSHFWNDGDNWYSCPLAPDGCDNDMEPKDTCTCMANEHNKKVEELYQAIIEQL